MRVEIDNEWKILPIGVVEICISYIHDGVLKMYYGPFARKRNIDLLMFNELPRNGTVNVEYDPKTPWNARLTVENEQSIDFNKSCWLFMITALIFNVVWFVYMAWMNLKDLYEKIRMIYFVVVGSFTLYLIFLIAKRRVLACYRKIRLSKLHIEWTSNDPYYDDIELLQLTL